MINQFTLLTGCNGKTDNTVECDRQKTFENAPPLSLINGDGHTTSEAEEPPYSKNENGQNVKDMGTVSYNNDIDQSNSETECEESLDSQNKISGKFQCYLCRMNEYNLNNMTYHDNILITSNEKYAN